MEDKSLVFNKYKSMEEFKKDMHKDDKWWETVLYATWWPFYRFCASFNWKYIKGIKRFIQRGYRGYADSDVWSFDAYLCDVIIGGVNKLKNNLNGHPAGLKNIQEWAYILNKIIYTFDIERGVIDAEVIIPKDYKEFIRLKKTFKGQPFKILTGAECKKYEEGWKLFKKYFGGLWD